MNKPGKSSITMLVLCALSLFSVQASAAIINLEYHKLKKTQSNDYIALYGEHPMPPSLKFAHHRFARPIIDLALILGNNNSLRTGTIVGPSGKNADHNTKQSPLVGLELAILFGKLEDTHPFIYLNAVRMFAPQNTLFSDYVPLAPLQSTIVLQTSWTGRFGVGVESKPFMANLLRLGVGVGVAAIPQRLTAMIGESNYTSIYKNRTRLQPTFVTKLKWEACRACFIDHGVFVTGELVIDHYPAIEITGNTKPLNNTYTVSANQRWQVQENIVIGIHL